MMKNKLSLTVECVSSMENLLYHSVDFCHQYFLFISFIFFKKSIDLFKSQKIRFIHSEKAHLFIGDCNYLFFNGLCNMVNAFSLFTPFIFGNRPQKNRICTLQKYSSRRLLPPIYKRCAVDMFALIYGICSKKLCVAFK